MGISKHTSSLHNQKELTVTEADPADSASEMRAGTRALSLLAVPLNGTLLQQLSEGPKRLAELRVASGSAPPSTLRAHIKGLEEVGVVVKRGREGSLGVVECVLTDAGEDLLVVLAAVESWLQRMPGEPAALSDDVGKAAMKALVGGWSSTVVHTLAAGPLSLSELASGIRTVSYPSVERRLAAMRLAGQVVACTGDGRGTPYEVTEWLQRGVTPMAAAVRWEYCHLPDSTTSMTRIDTEAAFQLALPLLRMSSKVNGSCLMGVEIDSEEGRLAGAIAQVSAGRVDSCSVSLTEAADASAIGSSPAWGRALIGDEDGDDRLNFSGRRRLAEALIASLGEQLFRQTLR